MDHDFLLTLSIHLALKFLQALRILLTPPESYYGMILDCDLYSLFEPVPPIWFEGIGSHDFCVMVCVVSTATQRLTELAAE